MIKRTIREMAESLYDNPDIIDAVIADADRLHNIAAIEAGELVLPHPHDAATWHNRNKGDYERQSVIADQQKRIAALEERLASITSKGEH